MKVVIGDRSYRLDARTPPSVLALEVLNRDLAALGRPGALDFDELQQRSAEYQKTGTSKYIGLLTALAVYAAMWQAGEEPSLFDVMRLPIGGYDVVEEPGDGVPRPQDRLGKGRARKGKGGRKRRTTSAVKSAAASSR